ncbi:MAG: N-acetyl-alpha-D-glucosaminyl L-malate synthase BshA [Acidobacteriota bacterium]|nr:N-acetyl-alpha-D-glucosaminyl L-malate synthase BshA [Acidobacteriota bacterium]
MNVGIVCYPTVGGSGIVATELAKALAERGHQVRLISTDMPFRLPEFHVGVAFHAVQTPGYPLLREPQYLLSLANKIVQVSREHELDIIHAHYAIPHAAAAYLARQILTSSSGGKVPRVITTLHGTDVTLIGSDRSYSETAAFCINQSDGVTAVSESLRADTYRQLAVQADIRVIPNFLDCSIHHRSDDAGLRARFTGGQDETRLVIHVSNFRPVKQVDVVIDIFGHIHKQVPSKLLLVGDGPDLDKAGRRVRDLGLSDAVVQLGEQEQIVPLLSVADLFLLPSAQESFGLAALEAMACQVPVVASRVGGLPEVIDDGVTGFLHPPDAIDGMAQSAVELLTDRQLHKTIAAAALEAVVQRFGAGVVVPAYETFYAQVLDRQSVAV